ncbi:MAG: hypothetical protein LC114_08170 [Bryobacterales bacterium]|nr:hypothetical protein [Bryobacterales bacterium]
MRSDFKLDLVHRPRRLRRTSSIRGIVEETVLRPADFIAPLFVVEGSAPPDPIASMPGVFRYGCRDLVKECRALRDAGVSMVALFPKLALDLKDARGKAALDEDGLVLRAVREVKSTLPEMTVMTDIALDPAVMGTMGFSMLLVATWRTTQRLNSFANGGFACGRGCGFCCAIDMMDERSGAIRKALDLAGHLKRQSWRIRQICVDIMDLSRRRGKRWCSRDVYSTNAPTRSILNRREALMEVSLDESEG